MDGLVSNGTAPLTSDGPEGSAQPVKSPPQLTAPFDHSNAKTQRDEMTNIATDHRMEPETQGDMSSPSTNTPDMSIEERLLAQVTCRTQHPER